MQLLKVSGLFELSRGSVAPNGNAMAPRVYFAKNTSGGALARGDVVIMDWANCTADLLAVKTTTSGNDVTVAGMVYDLSIAASAVGRIQCYGPTKQLKVDGTTDIAIADGLGTFTTAKIAQKSTTVVFAYALEAYATNDSAGVIDAFITLGDSIGDCRTV